MRKLVSAKLAANILLGIYGLLLIFHLLVLAQVVPSDISRLLSDTLSTTLRTL